MEQKFDPMTGELIREADQPENVTPEQEVRFDPMTGQPLQQIGFDPMTGQPVYGIPGQENQGSSFDGKRHTGKKKLPVVIACVVVAVVAVAGVAAAAVTRGAFLSKPNKVLLAAKRTFTEQPQFMEDLGLDDMASILNSDKYTLDFSAEYSNSYEGDGASVEASYISTSKEKQLNGSVSVEGSPQIEVQTALTEESLKVCLPSLSDDVYVYNYKEGGGGYLKELLDESGVVDIEDVDQALASVFSQKTQKKQAKELQSIILGQIRDLDWSAEDTKSFKINGKSRKAKGYGTTISGDDVEDFLDAIYDYMEDNYEGDLSLVKRGWDDMTDEMEDMPETDCAFYIYKGKLAAIIMEMDDVGEMELLFKGGAFRMQNMELTFDIDGEGSYTVELEGETTKTKETYELSAEGHPRWQV
jgi:hypothetical protein